MISWAFSSHSIIRFQFLFSSRKKKIPYFTRRSCTFIKTIRGRALTLAERWSCGVSKEILKGEKKSKDRPARTPNVVTCFVVASHYQNLQIILLLSQACLSHIVAATVAVATTGPAVSTLFSCYLKTDSVASC